jgi:hypothetical protein
MGFSFTFNSSGSGVGAPPASATPTFSAGGDTHTNSTSVTTNYTAKISNYSTLNALSGATWAAPTTNVGTASRSGDNITVVVPVGYQGDINIGIGFTETGKTQSFGFKSTTASVATSATPAISGSNTVVEGNALTFTITAPLSGTSYAWSANEGTITPSPNTQSAVWSPASTSTNRNAVISVIATESGKLPSAPANKTIGVTVFYFPVTALAQDFEAKGTLAFGFDGLVPAYSGNTFKIKRLSDNTTASFGFAPISKQALLASALAWANGEADIVEFLDQFASGKLLSAVGVVPFARGGVIQRQQIQAALSGATQGFITPDNTKGSATCDISLTGTNYLQCTNANLVTSQGIEVHMLMSPKTRKFSGATVVNNQYEPVEWGAEAVKECYMGYGTSGTETNRVAVISNFGTASAVSFRRFPSVTTAYATPTTTPTMHLKQWASQVFSFVSNPTAGVTQIWQGGDLVGSVDNGTQLMADDMTSVHQQFRVGRQTTSAFAESTYKGNFLFSGVLITKTLTVDERRKVHERWSAYARYSLLQNQAWVEAQFEDYLVFKNATSAGLAGAKNKFNLAFNQSTFNGQNPSWAYNTPAQNGLSGLYSNAFDNMANQFEDIGTDKVGGQLRAGTIVTVIQTDPTYNRGDALTDVFAYTAVSPTLHLITQELTWDLKVAIDHRGFSHVTKATIKDPNDVSERQTNSYTSVSGITTTPYNGVNHTFDYRFKTITQAVSAEAEDKYDFKTQAQGLEYMATKNEFLHSKQGTYGANLAPLPSKTYVIIQTWENNPLLNENGTQAEIDEYMPRASKTITVCLLNNPAIGGLDGFFASEAPTGMSRLPALGSRLVAHADDKRTFYGTRHFFGVINRALNSVEVAQMASSIGQLL